MVLSIVSISITGAMFLIFLIYAKVKKNGYNEIYQELIITQKSLIEFEDRFPKKYVEELKDENIKMDKTIKLLYWETLDRYTHILTYLSTNSELYKQIKIYYNDIFTKIISIEENYNLSTIIDWVERKKMINWWQVEIAIKMLPTLPKNSKLWDKIEEYKNKMSPKVLEEKN